MGRFGRNAEFLAVVALLAAAPAGAIAAEKSGTAVAVVQSTEVSGAAGRRVLTVSAPVYMGDRIRTGAAGEAQIQLLDNTRLVVGPNSSMVVDSFVFDGGNRAQKVSLNAVRGAFRFITGSSRKGAYEIKTPTATIGVRGTEFDFTVDRRGELNFALFEGEARICTRAGQCTVLSGACSVVVAPRNRPLRRMTSIEERTRLLNDLFPYVAAQGRLRSDFRVDTSSCGTRRAQFVPGENALPARSIAAAGAPPPLPPPTTTASIGTNRSGLGDGTNPGQGAGHSNSPNANPDGGGTDNPSGNNGNGGGNGNGNGNGNAYGHNK